MHIRQLRKVKRHRQLAGAWQQYQNSNCETAWMHLLSRYTSGSHIHGFYQLFWPTMRRRMRLLWTLALLCALIVLIFITYLLAERHQRKLFQTVIADSRWPIRNIAFPVIFVCNKNRLNWSRLPEIGERYNITESQQPLLERVLTAYDALSISHLDVFEALQDQPLETLNHLNFTQIVSEMAWRCEELISECRWQTQSRNCCELFRPRRQQQGVCLAFHELEERSSAETGSGTGIVVRLLLNEALHAPGNREPKGFVLDVVEPGVWSELPISLVPDADTNVGIRAVYHFYDEATYGLPSVQRQCLLDYEQKSDHFQTLLGFKYMLENCLAECQQLYMLRYCNCTLDLFFPPSNHVGCKLKDLPCLAAHNHLLKNFEHHEERSYVAQNESGLLCDCLHNCKSLTLLTDVHKAARRRHLENARAKGSAHGSNRSILLNVYYTKNVILVYRTSLIYSWLDLIVSFGAICQLCLGCSIISLLELCYFGLFDLPRFCCSHYSLRRLY
ncbi:pickpocket protein 19 [Drosophila virilis]|uniref:pickpocket protein 19 n=1 Tax=Drosophila virilis TaxID=7244 RepID=UPI00017D4187|nr:pickpocket protein 19 [Drosophila virilis]